MAGEGREGVRRGARPERCAARARGARRRREERGAAGADLAPPSGRGARVGDAGEMRAQPGVERGAALGAVEDLALGLAAPEQVDDRARGGEERRIAAAPPARTTSSGSWPGGISAKRSERPAPRSGQREVDQPLGGGEAGGVAVERDHRLGREPPEPFELVPR